MDRKSLSSPVTAIFLALETGLYTAFITLDITQSGKFATPLKYTAVLLCLLYALFQALRGGEKLVCAALLLTVGADRFLLGNVYLLTGLCLFLAVQLLYRLRLRPPGTGGRLAFGRAAVPLTLFAAALLEHLTPLTLLAAVYFVLLLSNTLLAWLGGRPLFAAGLTLMVLGDVCVGMNYLGILYPLSSVGMWLFYLPSQVLIVLSAGVVFHETK